MTTPARRGTPVSCRTWPRGRRLRDSGPCESRDRSGVRRRHLAVAGANGRKAADDPLSRAVRGHAARARPRESVAVPQLLAVRPPVRRALPGERQAGAERRRRSVPRQPRSSRRHLDVSEPRGSFVLQPGGGPVVLLSAGIGATPVLAMLHALTASASPREILVAARRSQPKLAVLRRRGAPARRAARPRSKSRLVQPAGSGRSAGPGLRRRGHLGIGRRAARCAARCGLLSLRPIQLPRRSPDRPRRLGRFGGADPFRDLLGARR